MKTGLILEGLAHRAIYTAGVLDVFMEKGVTFDGVICDSIPIRYIKISHTEKNKQILQEMYGLDRNDALITFSKMEQFLRNL